MNLTEHFTLEELTVSAYAIRYGLDNTPPEYIVDNLRLLASELEHVRMLIGAPVIILSGYRSPEVNLRVGGSANSMHVEGLAADFIAPRFGTAAAVAQAVNSSPMLYDQLILEFGNWVHLSVHPVNPRRQALTAVRRSDGRTEYLMGLKP